MTINELIQRLIVSGVRRAIVVERMDSPGFLEVQVARRKMISTSTALGPHLAMAIHLKVTPLPWWKCWFTNFQCVRREI